MGYEIKNQKGAGEFQMKNLIWKIDNENENGGYWECEHCGAIYNQSQNWKPFADYCMKCKGDWK